MRYQYDLTTYIVRMTAGKIITTEMVPQCTRQFTPFSNIYLTLYFMEYRSPDNHTILEVRYQYALTTYVVRMTAGNKITPEMVPQCTRQFTPFSNIYLTLYFMEYRSPDIQTI